MRAIALFAALAATATTANGLDGIVLLFPDQWRYDWDGRRSDIMLAIPTVRALMAKGTRFEHAYVPAPVCAPSRSCLAAGREYDETGVPNNFNNDMPVTPDEPTFYKLLRDVGGWHVMATGKDDLTKATQPGPNGTFHQAALGFSDAIRYSGKMDVLNGGPHEPYGLMLNRTTVPLQDGTVVNAYDAHRACLRQQHDGLCDATSYPNDLYEDDWTTVNALTLLRRRPRDKKFLLHISFPGPHPPFTVTPTMRDAVANRHYPAAIDNRNAKPDDCPAHNTEPYTGEQCAYAAEIENLDRQMASVLQAIGNETDMSNVLVVFASDHGTMLQDHGDTGKTMPWQPSASVPLVVAGPGVAMNQTVSVPVATMDLAGTFLDLAGVPPHANMTTRSLVPLLRDGDAAASQYRDFVSSGLQSMAFNDSAAVQQLLEAGKQTAALRATAADENGAEAASRVGEDRPSNGVAGDGYNWRMVVQRQADGRQLKFICCKGRCNGAPSTAPGPAKDGYTRILYDTIADPNDMSPLHDSDAAEKLRQLLPPGHCPAAHQSE